ncbi:hypothetical protein QFC22_000391 [Naganishia vaughanmartiniae]|uniref:Uncharacterized protein n=1 Tax=Naganishia vaughanmartiniae TaxID=1424756 RepID=A0ACC2XPZ9_9TREE|nr:hypothetical protein QFC22_000391 [Naganishia vaughanmartiniae]
MLDTESLVGLMTVVFVKSDLKSRVTDASITTVKRRDNVVARIEAGDFPYLLEFDQLRKEMKNNSMFRLRAFREAPIHFAPTYKYTPNSKEYDQSQKQRTPAW